MGADLTKEISLLWPGKDGRKMYHDLGDTVKPRYNATFGDRKNWHYLL